MNTALSCRICVTGFLLATLSLTAQTAPAPGSSDTTTPATQGTSPDPQVTTAVQATALNFRSDMAAGVGNGTETPEAAVIRMKAQSGPSGLQIDPAADFAYAAIDVGQRLITLGKPAAAETFFKAAEQSLASLASSTADAQAQAKAQYLRKLCLIRGKYLNEAAQAKLDIAQALTLQPGDKGLLRAQQTLANSHAVLPFLNPTN